MNIREMSIESGEYPMPEMFGSKSGKLLIVGTAKCVWDDLAKVSTTFLDDADIMCVNDMGMHFPWKFHHWYSNDDIKLLHWFEGRRDSHTAAHGRDIKFHTIPELRVRGPNCWPFPGQGSSGLLAYIVGLALGYDDILGTGTPFDDTGHYYDPPPSSRLFGERKQSNFTNETQDRHMERAIQHFEGKVNVVSGRLASKLRSSS